jgi:hypothetical protein
MLRNPARAFLKKCSLIHRAFAEVGLAGMVSFCRLGQIAGRPVSLQRDRSIAGCDIALDPLSCRGAAHRHANDAHEHRSFGVASKPT